MDWVVNPQLHEHGAASNEQPKTNSKKTTHPSPSTADIGANGTSGYGTASVRELEADDGNGELSAPSTCSTNQTSQWSTTGLASTAVEPPGSVPEERQPQCAESPSTADTDPDLSTQVAQEETDYWVAISKQEMCVPKRDVIFTMNVITCAPLHRSYIRLDADRRQRFIECHHVDCFCKECGKVAHTEPVPVCKGEEEGIPTQCSNKCHCGVLVC